MMTAAADLLSSTTREHLRPFDVSRDLNPVADLIAQCFADTLDLEGQRYLDQMRNASRNPRLLRWASSVTDYAMLPLRGFVWEVDGRIVGNLNLIPMAARGSRFYLIANVAVHPDHRQQGIARALTQTALESLQTRPKVKKAWLQVRADNEPAVHLYQTQGFQERARRTVWCKRAGATPSGELKPGFLIRPHRSRYWSRQKSWLNRLYPPELAWNLHINVRAMQPGLIGFLHRQVSGLFLRQVVALRDGDLQGVLSWRPNRSHPFRLWLAAPPGGEATAVRALLGPLDRTISSRRDLVLDFPGGLAVEALEAVGFRPRNTFIWMQIDLV